MINSCSLCLRNGCTSTLKILSSHLFAIWGPNPRAPSANFLPPGRKPWTSTFKVLWPSLESIKTKSRTPSTNCPTALTIRLHFILWSWSAWSFRAGFKKCQPTRDSISGRKVWNFTFHKSISSRSIKWHPKSIEIHWKASKENIKVPTKCYSHSSQGLLKDSLFLQKWKGFHISSETLASKWSISLAKASPAKNLAPRFVNSALSQRYPARRIFLRCSALCRKRNCLRSWKSCKYTSLKIFSANRISILCSNISPKTERKFWWKGWRKTKRENPNPPRKNFIQ